MGTCGSSSALKHGAYSATAVLPGESQAEFEKLHQEVVDEFLPSGALEHDVVLTMARLLWRKQNFLTLRIAERAQSRWNAIMSMEGNARAESSSMLTDFLFDSDPIARERIQHARAQAKNEMDQLRKELGDWYELAELGELATVDGLTKELEVQGRLDAAIARCLKQLLLLRGVKSISAAPTSESLKRIPGPQQAA